MITWFAFTPALVRMNRAFNLLVGSSRTLVYSSWSRRHLQVNSAAVHYWREHRCMLFPLLQTGGEVSKVVFTHARALPWCISESKKLYVMMSFSTHYGLRSHAFFYTVIHMLHLSSCFHDSWPKKVSTGLQVSVTPES